MIPHRPGTPVTSSRHRDAPRALVLGATGHIGQAVVRELLHRGWRVSAATRQPDPPSLRALGVTVTPGDADRPGQMDAWVRDHTAVVDAGAPYPLHLWVTHGPGAGDPFEHARQRMGSLLDAVGRHGASLAYVSSFTTLPRRDTGAAAVEARLRRRLHPYFGVKSLMESMVLAAARGGVPAAVVNPTVCLGPWDPKPDAQSLVALLLRRAVPAVAGQVVNVVDVRDVAVGIAATLSTRRFGVPIPLAGHDLPADDLARRICTLGAIAPPPLRASARLGVLAALWSEAAWASVGIASPVPALSALLLCDGGPMAVGDTQRALGAHPRPLDETLRDAVAWRQEVSRSGAP